VERGDPESFIKLANFTLDILKTEGDFLDFLETLADFYRRLDIEESDKIIQKIIDKRSTIHAMDDLKSDHDISLVKELLNKPLKL